MMGKSAGSAAPSGVGHVQSHITPLEKSLAKVNGELTRVLSMLSLKANSQPTQAQG